MPSHRPHRRSLLNRLLAWGARGLPAARKLAALLPKRFRKPAIAGLVVLGVLAPIVWKFHAEAWHAFREFYGPDVVIGVLPGPGSISRAGTPHLLYEFTFARRMVVPLRTSEDVERLARGPSPVLLRPFLCPGEETSGQLYKLSIVSHNMGDRTAEQYQLTLSFSGPDLRQRDPGVRIVHMATDDLRITYVYQQEPTIRRPSCITEPLKTAGASDLSRQTYADLGLTRDMAIVSGTLPAHVFQTADLIVKIPCSTSVFVVLFHVQCSNCRWFYRTMSLGQAVQASDRLTAGCQSTS